MLRAPLRSASKLSTRSIASFSFRPVPAVKPTLSAQQDVTGAKSMVTTPPRRIGSSSILGDGGNEEAPHSGINVDRPIRMDT